MAVTKEQLKKLQNASVLRKELDLLVRWRILTNKGGIARIAAYQDARDVQRVLDHVCGPQNWSNEPRNINSKLYMVIGINTQEEGWVFKADVGVESNQEAVKGESSDAFKRAAVMWGIFRDLYSMDYIVLKSQGKYALTEDGTPLQSPESLNLYCNNLSSSIGHLRKLYFSMKDKIENDDNLLEAFKTIKEYCNE